MLKIIIRAIFILCIFLLAFFWAAGRWDWVQGWAYVAIITTGGVINDFLVWRKCPELLKRRGEFGEGTKTWDKIILFVFGVTSVLTMITGALDAGRFQWSYMPPILWSLGFVLYVAGQGIVTWSMLVNPFFEKTARIQTDRGQKVIDAGPYQHVRHPGYAGIIFGLVMGSPLLLGSWWAFIPAVATAVGLVIRTSLEDTMLQAELDGYADYAKRVRYRLVPFVW